MESEALVLFQQTTRGTGSRRFKVYRTTEFLPVSRLDDRFETYLRRNRFPQEVHTPHWLETAGPLMEATLAKVGARFRQFTTYHLFAVTNRALHPFLAVPVAVDVLPALSGGVRLRLYDRDDCDEAGVPHPDAEATVTFDSDSYDLPLSGPVGEGGAMESLHLLALRAANRLAEDPSRGVAVGDDSEPTAVVPDGDRVIRVDLLSPGPLRRLASDGLFVNYGHEAVPGDDLDRRLGGVLRQTARARYQYARHLWRVRQGEADGTIAEDPDDYREEVEAARAHLFADVLDEFGDAVAPFSSGVYGGAIREDTATRADTFSLGGSLDVGHDDVVRTLDRADADYDPEYDLSLR